jgi:heptosyltransferase III
MPSSPQGRILVIRGGAIGDFILTLPALAALRSQFPRAHVELLGYPHIAQLAVAGGYVDELKSIEARALAGYFARGGILDPALAGYFQGFDLIVSYLYDPDAIFRTNLALSSKAQFIAGPHRPNESASIHATDVFLKPLEILAIFEADPVPRLELKMGRDDTLQPHAWLAVHPGSGSEDKNWPLPRWSSFLQKVITNSSLNILLIGGEAEGEKLRQLASVIPPHRLQLAQNKSLTQLAGLLVQCAFFIGHDSGISHLAAALDLAGMVLWGPSNPDIWSPRQHKFVVLRFSGGLNQLSAEVVFGRFQQLLPRIER